MTESTDQVGNQAVIEGYLNRIAYNKPGGDWCILEVESADGVVHKCLGIVPERVEGAFYKITGQWRSDNVGTAKVGPPTRGGKRALHFTKIELVVNNDERGVVAYLSTEAPGIGDKTARELYRVYGANTLTILMSPEVTRGVIKSFSEATAHRVAEFLQKHRDVMHVRKKLYGIGLKQSMINRLLSHYGPTVESKIRKDCFSLTDVRGVGFATVSSIADMLGIPKNDQGRIKAAVVEAMKELEEKDGHTCVTGQVLIDKTAKLLGFFSDRIEEQIAFASQEGYLMRGGGSFNISYFEKQENRKKDGQDGNQPEQQQRSQQQPSSQPRRQSSSHHPAGDDNPPVLSVEDEMLGYVDRDQEKPDSLAGESEWELPW